MELQNQQNEIAADQTFTGQNCIYRFTPLQSVSDITAGVSPKKIKLDSFSEAFSNRISGGHSQEEQSWDAQSCQVQLFCSQSMAHAVEMVHEKQEAMYSERSELHAAQTGTWEQHQQSPYLHDTRQDPQHGLPSSSGTQEIVPQQRVHHRLNFQHCHPSLHMTQETPDNSQMTYTSLPTNGAFRNGKATEQDLGTILLLRSAGLMDEPAQCFYQDFQRFTHPAQGMSTEGNAEQDEYVWKDPLVLDTVSDASPASAFRGPLKIGLGLTKNVQKSFEEGWAGTNGVLWHTDVQSLCKLPNLLQATLESSPGHKEKELSEGICLPKTVPNQMLQHASRFSETQASPCSLSSYYTGVPFSSCLRLTRFQADCSRRVWRYTPSPMLNPLRKGTGLFANLLSDLWDSSSATSPHEENLHPASKSSSHGVQLEEAGNIYGAAIPQINIGPDYQAELPELNNPISTTMGRLPEELMWMPQEELEWDADVQQSVDTLLKAASSSVFPGGGTNQELALHHLSEAGGDILATLERLLLRDPRWPTSHPLADYHYTGSDVWNPHERRLFNRAFTLHRKDFHSIQKMVRTRDVLQCVEYYYLHKKTMQLQRKRNVHCGEESISQEGHKGVLSCPPLKNSHHRGEMIRASSCASTIGCFPCKQCGKMFYKIKSRNAHMKIHRPQEEWRHNTQCLHPAARPPELALTDDDYSLWNSLGQFAVESSAEPLTGACLIPQYADDTKLIYRGRLFS
ncbi:hypothetical protein NDU88_006099 [Pleurodeles waltl]|uniref:Uncharacterized protein n=1 Tax=Pleurodeles waltl TaxID=8319 RepID=A0AAV7N0B1_PLEWA|nr:hypothetical protein NDU88_006099 [Pleurodeles waltl]